MAASVSMAEVARMAANSNLRIDITSFPAQTVRAPLTTARSIDGGCGRPTGRTRLDASRDAPVRRRQLHPTYDRNQAAETCSDLPDGPGSNPNPDQRRQHSQCHGQSQDHDRGGRSTCRSRCDVLSHVSVRARAKTPLRRNRSPPFFSRAPHPRGCATSNCPAMLNEKSIDLTGPGEFSVCRM